MSILLLTTLTILTTLAAWFPAILVLNYGIVGLMIAQVTYTTWALVPGNVSKLTKRPFWLGCAFVMTLVSGSTVIAGQIIMLGWLAIPYIMGLTAINALAMKEIW